MTLQLVIHTIDDTEHAVDLQEPVLSPEAARILAEQAWDMLLPWIIANAPPEVVELARGIDSLSYYRLTMYENAGGVPTPANELIPAAVVKTVNSLAQLHWF